MLRFSLVIFSTTICSALVLAGGGDGTKISSGKRRVQLWPPASQPTSQPDELLQPGQRRRIDGWIYRAEKSGQPRDGVPWELIVTPDEEHAPKWQRGTEGAPLPALSGVLPRKGDVLKVQPKPRGTAIEVP